MSYIEKNKTRITFTVIGLLLLIVIVGLWLQRQVFHAVVDIQGTVYPTNIFVGDTLFYADKTPYSAVREWKFGDGGISVTDSGYYLYKAPGYYQIMLTLNGKYSKSFSIQVKSKPIVNIEDSVTTIDAPVQARQFENVVFKAYSKTARLFNWKFGESGTIDSREQNPIYAYQKPGNYTVTLFTEETDYPITHNITILPSFRALNDSISVEDVYSKIDNDFKYHLQKIADGADFNLHYNYLLNKYLCNNENTAIKVNTSKINTFYYYCAGLQFDKKSVIQSVKTSFDEKMNCVTKIDIVQEKNENN
jgi:hypothetical protein